MKFYLIALVLLIIVGCTPAVYRVSDSTPEFSPILSPTDIPNPVTPDIVQEKMIDLAISNLSLSGGWNASFATQSGTSTIDGQISRRGVTVNNNATIEYFLVQNGSAGSGGGIANNSTLTLSASTISNNRTTNYTYGGGIYNAGTLTINTQYDQG